MGYEGLMVVPATILACAVILYYGLISVRESKVQSGDE